MGKIGADHNRELAELVAAYLGRNLDRRGFLLRAAGLGLSLPGAAALLAACGDDGGGGDTTAAGADTTPATDAPSEAEPTAGGTLREGYHRDFSKHDPVTTNWYDPAFSAIYETILTNDPDGADVPQVATAFERSDDGLTYTFTIPEGRTFQSGEPLTAEAVAAFYTTMQGSFISTLASPVDTYEAPDPTTLVINMKNTWLGTLGPHKTGYWAIINVKAWEESGGRDDPANPFGTEYTDGLGPFTHTEWVPGSHVLVTRWEDYPGSVVPWFENKGKAYLDAIRWVYIAEESQRATQLENGELDTLLRPAFQDTARLEGNADMTVYRFPEWSGYILSMNRDYDEYFGDITVRQAMSHAIDREGLVEAIFFGDAISTYGPFPGTDRNYEPGVEALGAFDIDLANQMLEDAGWTLGDDGVRAKEGVKLQFEFAISNESLNVAIGTAVSGMLKEIGVDAQVTQYDLAVLFERQSAEARDAVPMSLFFWLWPIPLDVLTLFSSKDTVPVPNFSHALTPAIDDAIAAWQQSATEEEAQAAASAFQLAWAEELPYISTVTQNAVFVKRNVVHGWLPTLWNLYPYYNDVWIEQ